MLASGGLSGGLSSSIAGGNFFAGVRQGLITSGLNHLGHMVVDGIENQNQEGFGNATVEVTDEIVGEQTIRDYPTNKGNKYKTPLYKVIVSGTDVDGNPISKEFKAIRFGVKTNADGTRSVATLAAGTYTVKDFSASHYSNTGALRIIGKYLIHMNSLVGPDGNNGCIAIAGGRQMWNQFKNYLSQLTFNSDLSNAAKNGNIKVNIQYAPTPKLY